MSSILKSFIEVFRTFLCSCVEVCCSERRETAHHRIHKKSAQKSSEEQPTFSEAAAIPENPRMQDNIKAYCCGS